MWVQCLFFHNKNYTFMKKIVALVFFTALFISSSYSQWIVQNMPHSRGQLQSAKMGNVLYFIGGCDNNFNPVSTVDVYNSSTNSWLTSTNISSPRCFSASVCGDSALYVAGGVSTWSNVYGSKVLDIYKNGVWTSITLPDSTCFGQALHVGNKIMIAGHLKRFNSSLSILVPSDLVFVYDEITQTLSVDTLSQARTFIAAATDGTIAIFAGGSHEFNKVSDVVDIYNSSTDTWSTATLSQARCNLAAIFAGGKFFFAGGAGQGTNLSYNTVDIFDGTTWTTAELCEARVGLTASSVGDKVFFIGGGNVNSQALLYTSQSSVVDIFDISQNSWSSNFMNYSKVTHTSISAGNKVFVAGGISGSSTLNCLEVYDTTVGVDDSIDQDKGSLFPNPSTDQIYLKIPSDLLGSEFYITNIFGLKILNAKAENNLETINISSFSKGLYFIHFTNNSELSVKFVKQ